MKKSEGEATTAKNLEKKFDQGQDVLDYFDMRKARVIDPKSKGSAKASFAYAVKRNCTPRHRSREAGRLSQQEIVQRFGPFSASASRNRLIYRKPLTMHRLAIEGGLPKAGLHIESRHPQSSILHSRFSFVRVPESRLIAPVLYVNHV